MDATESLRSLETRARPGHAHTSVWVADALRSGIAEGRFTPGMRLSEQSLADALRVSRNTLRDAFTMLASESIVTRIPNRGVFVASPGPADVRETYNVRRAIEPGAILWGTLTDTALDAMQAIVDGAHAARDAGDIRGMADANQALHEAIVALTGSTTLEKLMARVLAQMRLVFHAMATVPDFHSHYVERNQKLLTLMRDDQQVRAANALRDYLDTAEAELLGHLATRDR